MALSNWGLVLLACAVFAVVVVLGMSQQLAAAESLLLG